MTSSDLCYSHVYSCGTHILASLRAASLLSTSSISVISLLMNCWGRSSAPCRERCTANITSTAQLHYSPESRSGWAWHPDGQTGEGKRREIKTKQPGQTSLRQKKFMKINVVFCESMQKWLLFTSRSYQLVTLLAYHRWITMKPEQQLASGCVVHQLSLCHYVTSLTPLCTQDYWLIIFVWTHWACASQATSHVHVL